MATDLSVVQIAVLGILADEGLGVVLTGEEVRDRMEERGSKRTGPNFYQVMARLESSKLVEPLDKEKIIDGKRYRQKAYCLTSKGQKELDECLRSIRRASGKQYLRFA